MTKRHVIGGLVLENGVVVKYWHRKRIAHWVQCPLCGPQPPLLEDGFAVTHQPSSIVYGLLLACSQCGEDGPYKEHETPAGVSKKPHTKCNRRCTEGKRYCSCRCEGRCHGEMKCFCNDK